MSKNKNTESIECTVGKAFTEYRVYGCKVNGYQMAVKRGDGFSGKRLIL